MSNILARNLRQRRQAAGLSQTELADRSGLSQTWVSRLERGAGNPTLETLQSLAEAFEVEVTALLDEDAA